MRVLLIDAYEPDDPSRSTASATAATLRSNGCDVEHQRLHDLGFGRFMTADELRAYRTPEPLIAPETRKSGATLAESDALVLCYPAVMFGVPPVLKSWHERVLVPGVGFRLDHKRRVRPGMTQIRRIGAVATTSHRRSEIARARDLGRRTVMRTMRMNCHRHCRRTFLTVRSENDPISTASQIERAFKRWR